MHLELTSNKLSILDKSKVPFNSLHKNKKTKTSCSSTASTQEWFLMKFIANLHIDDSLQDYQKK